IIDGVYDIDDAKRERKAAQDQASYELLSEKQILKEIKRIEKAMHDSAKNLEFEKAADFRDQLKKLKAKFYGADVPDEIL
ncbi:MAG: UvrB/UvrC motif-containing protein, partial [Methylophilaceae bacterium]|nr:UvrB/UvrC motif-containing protein [Methyloradius sp.]